MGPYAVGLVLDYTGSYAGGLIFLAALLLVGAVITLRLRHLAIFAGERLQEGT